MSCQQCGAEWDATANYSKVKALPVRRIYYWLQIRHHLQLLMNLDTVSVHAFSTPATGKYMYLYVRIQSSILIKIRYANYPYCVTPVFCIFAHCCMFVLRRLSTLDAQV